MHWLNSIEMELSILAIALLAILSFGFSLASWVRQQRVLSAINGIVGQLNTELLAVNAESDGKSRQETEKKISPQRETVMADEQGYAPYSQATRLLDGGAKLEDVVRKCGISRAEAELMGLMHRQMKRRGPRTF